MNLREAKKLVWDCVTTLVPARKVFSPDLRFWGPAPIRRLTGRDAYFESVVQPMASCFEEAEKEPYFFLGGRFLGAIWVAATGNISARMAKPWLGIPRSEGFRRLRFGEFYKIEGGVVTEIRCLLDIPGLAAQAGIGLLPPCDGSSGIPPGPVQASGIMAGPQPQEATIATRNLVKRMIAGCNRLDGSDLSSQGMERFWCEDMVWHGPWGIGSCYGLKEFYSFAQGPSARSFPNRRGRWPKDAFVAEGNVAAFTGWPSLVGNFTGRPFHGIPPTHGPIGQTIMDFYIRGGDKLPANWVMIDLIGFASDCGIDLLAEMPEGLGSQPAG